MKTLWLQIQLRDQVSKRSLAITVDSALLVSAIAALVWLDIHSSNTPSIWMWVVAILGVVFGAAGVFMVHDLRRIMNKQD